MSESEVFESVRREPDPIKRGRRATELLTQYQQRTTELARLRRAAVEQAHQESGLSYTEIAAAFGLTKGRITQIRNTAPTRERAFFGVGPVMIGVPWRYQTTDRERPLIAAEDAATGDTLQQLLESLALTTTREQIQPDRATLPPGDVVLICGPKSAPVAAQLIGKDPALSFVSDNGRWFIQRTDTGERLASPSDDAPSTNADLAYVARHEVDDRVIVHIAGLHAIGSLGAAIHVQHHLAELFKQLEGRSASFVVRVEYDGLSVTNSATVAGPFPW